MKQLFFLHLQIHLIQQFLFHHVLRLLTANRHRRFLRIARRTTFLVALRLFQTDFRNPQLILFIQRDHAPASCQSRKHPVQIGGCRRQRRIRQCLGRSLCQGCTSSDQLFQFVHRAGEDQLLFRTGQRHIEHPHLLRQVFHRQRLPQHLFLDRRRLFPSTWPDHIRSDS